ncbi:hypothetical protein VQ03_24475 [Methylobacterium tarhaniae]|uniref:Uncharacterized protein n=1 Tax=Methylobacterium tarhaniae TaxID=1187852 RepID=A0A0J6SJJ1_9HYPH|nr:hypothetical protein [Methylobacterium tarhaniae]KMO33804.1 hypothetical protein VQ03_24475 [Methylobacterium tarhaniae]
MALAKLVAWREKDRDWLQSGLKAGLFSLTEMQSRLDRMPKSAPDGGELLRRLSVLAATCRLEFDRGHACSPASRSMTHHDTETRN